MATFSQQDKALFTRFLKENNVYSNFTMNYIVDHARYIPFWHEMSRERRIKYDLVSAAFSWLHTPQGFAFWSKIDKKWRNSLKIK